MVEITREQARDIDQLFSEWIHDLGLEIVDIEPGRVRMRMPYNERLVRMGGVICGQALMAAADSAMVFAVANVHGKLVPMTTVSQSTTFMRAAMDGDVLIEADILRSGRHIVFGEVTMYMDGSDEPVAHASCTYALLQPRS